jgi:hypothetical protein
MEDRKDEAAWLFQLPNYAITQLPNPWGRDSHALHTAIPVARNSRTSAHALALAIPLLAHGNLLRHQDG